MNFEDWLSCDDDVKVSYCINIETLHADLTFCALTTESYCGKSHRSAVFVRKGLRFRLVPGSNYELGYSARIPHSVDEEALIKSLDDEDLEFLDSHLSKPRLVELGAFLIAEEALDLTEFEETGELVDVPAHIRATHPDIGEQIAARRELELTLQQAVERLDADGLALSTADQWEIASSGGSRSLFRWKELPPFEFYPSATQENMQKRRDWLDSLLKSGALEAEGAAFLMGSGKFMSFDLHLCPNLFGLKIGSPFNRGELCRNGELKGGDGGEAECGGYNSLYAWVPFAPSYFNLDREWKAGHVRPVLELNG